LDTIKAALSAFALAVLRANDSPTPSTSAAAGPSAFVAVSAFTGASELVEVAPFSNNATLLNQTIWSFQPIVTDPSTNLNGAIVLGLQKLRNSPLPVGVLLTRALAVFTDGKDTAHRVSDSDDSNAVEQSHFLVYLIGLLGEVQPTFLQRIGVSAYFEIESIDGLRTKFALVAQSIVTLTSAAYVVAYCSPSRALGHTFSAAFGQSQVFVNFDAASFTGQCSQSSLETCANCAGRLQVAPDQQVLSCTTAQPRGGPDPAVVIGVVLGVLAFIFLAVVGFFVYRKYRNDGGWSPLVL